MPVVLCLLDPLPQLISGEGIRLRGLPLLATAISIPCVGRLALQMPELDGIPVRRHIHVMQVVTLTDVTNGQRARIMSPRAQLGTPLYVGLPSDLLTPPPSRLCACLAQLQDINEPVVLSDFASTETVPSLDSHEAVRTSLPNLLGDSD